MERKSLPLFPIENMVGFGLGLAMACLKLNWGSANALVRLRLGCPSQAFAMCYTNLSQTLERRETRFSRGQEFLFSL